MPQGAVSAYLLLEGQLELKYFAIQLNKKMKKQQKWKVPLLKIHAEGKAEISKVIGIILCLQEDGYSSLLCWKWLYSKTTEI